MATEAPAVLPVVRCTDVARTIRFLVDALGFTEHQVDKGPDGAIAHAELTLANGMVVLGPTGGPDVFDLGPALVSVSVDDVDAVHDHAVAAGAEVVYPLTDQEYGSRDFAVRDTDGNVWAFGTYRPRPIA